MARGWHYAKLSLSSALRLSYSGMRILLCSFFSPCRFCLFVFFFCSHGSFVDVPLIFVSPADHVPDWQPRTLLGIVEARSINVKKTTTTNAVFFILCFYSSSTHLFRQIAAPTAGQTQISSSS